jgi:hypothetical protein
LAVLVSSRATLLNSNGSVWKLRQYRNGYLAVLYVGMYLLDVIKMLVRGVNRSRSWISARASSWNTREWLLSRITDYEVDSGVT